MIDDGSHSITNAHNGPTWRVTPGQRRTDNILKSCIYRHNTRLAPCKTNNDGSAKYMQTDKQQYLQGACPSNYRSCNRTSLGHNVFIQSTKYIKNITKTNNAVMLKLSIYGRTKINKHTMHFPPYAFAAHNDDDDEQFKRISCPS